MHTSQKYMLELLSRRNDELASLLEIGKTIISSLELKDVLQEIMAQVERLFQPEVWSLLLVNYSSGRLGFDVAVSPVSNGKNSSDAKITEALVRQVVEEGKPLLITNLASEPRFSALTADALDYSQGSFLCVPLKIRDRVLGAIELRNYSGKHVFNEADLPLLGAVADFAAIAIDNAHNYKRISELVITDELTGLYNASHFQELLSYEIERTARYHSQLCLLFFDLDNFKSVNDTYGHLVGSRIIAEVGQMVKKHTRSSDRGARYGGDEYTILLPNTGKKGGLTVANNMLHRLREGEFFSDDGVKIQITASFGVAVFPDDAVDREGLIRAADTAMYRAKKAGRNQVAVCKP